jgi:hypothetical protein
MTGAYFFFSLFYLLVGIMIGGEAGKHEKD